MKKILVPTDFSENAGHAALYAAELAKKMNAELILLNVYSIYVPISEVPVVAVPPQEFEEDSKIALKNAAAKIPEGIKCKTVSIPGISTDEINAYVNDAGDIDLVVMGIRGTNRVSQLIIGSTATSVLRHTKVPVIIIPEKTEVVLPKTIVFAFDNKDTYPEDTVAVLEELCGRLHCKVRVVHVTHQPVLSYTEKHTVSHAAYSTFHNVDYTMHFAENEDVPQAINDFVDQQKADMVAMIYHKHGLFYRIFVGSRASKMAFYTRKPLLVMPEKRI